MKRNICIDIDGTMSSPYFFVPYLNIFTGKHIEIEDYTSTNWNIAYGPEYQDVYENFDERYSYIYEEVELLDGVKEVIDELVENGDDIHFVTARDHIIDSITKKWLEENGIDSSKVYSLGGNEGKVDMARNLDCDYFIEDDPGNVKNLLLAGFKVIIMDSNYNRNVIEELEEYLKNQNINKKEKESYINNLKNNLKRARNWEDIRKILL